MLILPSKDNLQEGVLMNKKSFWLYVVIMTMAVIAVVLAIFILVVKDIRSLLISILKKK